MFSIDDGTPLYRQMVVSYSESIAPGTASNRLTQAKSFLTFATYYGIPPLNLTSTQLCMYAQYLKNSYSAPSTVKNYLSGAKTWLAEHGGNLHPFSSFEYHQLVAGLTKRSLHVARRAAPLSWEHVQQISAFLDRTPSVPLSAKACLLIGYHTLLRSGNLLAPTLSSWGGAHTLMAKDLRLSDEGLNVSVFSTKTKSDPSPVTTLIPWHSDPLLCAAQAWFKYSTLVKPWILGPAFLIDSGLPLTPRILVGLFRLALQDCRDIDPARVSMHSLRRGAVQAAVAEGVNMNTIKERGMWKSDSGFAPYLL